MTRKLKHGNQENYFSIYIIFLWLVLIFAKCYILVNIFNFYIIQPLLVSKGIYIILFATGRSICACTIIWKNKPTPIEKLCHAQETRDFTQWNISFSAMYDMKDIWINVIRTDFKLHLQELRVIHLMIQKDKINQVNG